MKTYDWIIIGAGITGTALAYELAKTGFSVLLLEQYPMPQNATRYSYGGISYWAGTTPITQQLSQESMARYPILSQELDADIQFRELDLLLTIPSNSDPKTTSASYAHLTIPPTRLNIQEACELEPLLNKNAISGALTIKHGHIHPNKTAQAYIQAMLRLGGELQFTQVLELNQGLKSVKTTTATFHSANIAICAGGLSRQLLKLAGIPIKMYFSHAEIIETPPVDLRLRTLVTPANLQRLQLEIAATQIDKLWDESGYEPVAPILDAGAVQFLDGSLRLGQISRILTNPYASINSEASEKWLRTSINNILPTLEKLPGTRHHCLVAFTKDKFPLIGKIPEFENIYIFSGFSSPFVFVPPLATRFAKFVSGYQDKIISQMSPDRTNLS
ncbi:FAD-binding oxidoreductase [Anabaena cylindrica FACHB-243]|uniref:FAD dependent oxidoreductase n=1 Tax=Anabaena cylindrica (strain ATCC 27899 / PCC 7122) TaxID=272123 RepID=K9ZAX1_ANACC|nr:MULTISPECIES: FAD-binding oxidoreductase [Anabaena]AFZ56348.1 FAD dependent oxidoreductase [Anabaena cylindrica PCC 7122]MBD2418204.1 FAD-binding oxidoreductase [Anabaena cylindrica FACHB-243]MBY5283947.1 FAD-binding oxidoreductase [Anabaena sp. CCAP 1446/1C]MBY5308031.1 FAD-binding oxidoreductase [Anabaena sp. CCAP 1446/1C]MCM2409074.1 FAD-binding oxidoreductase [Anabaena sp. CCAP 1446/1C]